MTDWEPLDVPEQTRRNIQRALELACMTPDEPSTLVRKGETRDEAFTEAVRKLESP